ncbi:hypothetical protein H4R26_002661 [Coemansia thaxteri]|uniref:Uncharacterized protein n=1 Tax=Coemansia thaxteri TaxID=2663907 RepID=A0A9W8EFR9_9FUNG|nr:hypothetical protein H4R26_002661 [Coemansia thaxteri]KAJ2484202.1 hypothetical protein EV174_002619 [Coemansia sp. RSA 2320]
MISGCMQRVLAPLQQAAVALDIDGVLVKGKRALEEGGRALRMLGGHNRLRRRIPFVLLTNGGGVSEAEKAADVSRLLGVQIAADQIVLAHSPMRALAAEYAHKHVLVVGGEQSRCAHIARGYGLANVSTPNDVVAWRPSAWPFMPPPAAEQLSAPAVRNYASDPFHAVMVFHDSFDFGRDLQIATDVLRSRDATLGAELVNRQSVPLFMSNEDLIFSNDYARPRFGQGAYHVCLRAMWAALTAGAPLEYTLFGKPHAVQYRYAERLLDRLVLAAEPDADIARLHARRRIYAVGDNPAADIAGANAAGWTSVLVRTGIFSGAADANDPVHPAHHVADHVEDAVAWIVDSELARMEAPPP